jgi:PqqD family protein of HPr-rel-A system
MPIDSAPTCCDISLDAVPTRRPGLLCEILDDEAVFYDPAHHAMHFLNATAAFIWQCCDGETALADIVQRVESHFDVGEPGPERERLPDQVAQALNQLEESGLIGIAERFAPVRNRAWPS